jgi:hypothetical protein
MKFNQLIKKFIKLRNEISWLTNGPADHVSQQHENDDVHVDGVRLRL